MKRSWIFSGVVVLLVFTMIPMGFGATAATNQTTSTLSFPDTWKVSMDKMQAKQAEQLQTLAAKQSSPLSQRATSLSEEGSLPTLPADNASVNFKADEKGFVTAIVGLSQQPVAATAGQSGFGTEGQGQLNLVTAEHQQAIAKLAGLDPTIQVTQELSYAYNGLAISFPKEKLADVQALFGAANVHPSRTYYADLPHSVPLTGATNVWTNPGVKGEGMVIGVVDTGVDYNHPDLGGGFGNKVIAMINVAEHTGDAMDLNGHGTHVSGIMNAKAASPNGVTGMAPEAKEICAKIVKGGAGSASSEDIAAAFDWMLQKKLSGMNLAAINMSFGSPAGWRNASDPEQIAIQNCVDHGIFVSLSAGNEYYSVYSSNQYTWYGEDPSKLTIYPADIGIVGDPSNTPGAISTGASWNSSSRMAGYKVGSTANHYGYAAATGAPNPLSVFSPTADLPYIDCGIGGPSDIPAAVAGKIALIKRGTYTFAQKAQNAQAKGAIGVIIYNDAADWTRHDILNPTVEGGGITIPTVFSTYEQGNDLRVNQATYQTVRFDGVLTDVPVYIADKMVDFSSWGTDNNLNFKPEVSAPGGGIWSTVPLAQGGYDNYSGTSMAAPHVGAAAALIKQAQPAWTPAQIKTALLNTATLLTYPGSARYFSPRLQGAGRIQVDQALKTPVFVSNAATGLPYVPLGDTKAATSKTFTLQAMNTGGVDVTYDLSGVAQRYNSSRVPYTLTGATLNMPRGITVPAHASASFDVTLDLSGNTSYENIFVDGFIILTPHDSSLPTLHVPYILFWGDWQDNRYTADWIHNPVIDPPADDPTGWIWWGYTWMYTAKGSSFYYLGMDFNGNLDRNTIAISPNGDGSQDNAHPVLSFMRGTPDFSYEILKADGTLVTVAATDQFVPKNFQEYPYWSRGNNDWIWAPQAGTIPDGSYIARLKAEIPGTLTNGSGKYEIVDFPLTVDTVPPQIDLYYNLTKIFKGAGKYDFSVSWVASDDRSGLWGFQVWLDGTYLADLPPNATSYTFPALANEPHAFQVAAIDNAGNIGFSTYVYNGFTMTLPPSWSFFSMPGQTNPNPSVVLADLKKGYSLKAWNEVNQQWTTSGISFWQGDGYWLQLRQQSSFTFSSVLQGQPTYQVPMVTGRNDIGQPYPVAIPWQDIRISAGVGPTITLDQAFQMKIIRSIFMWNGYTYVNGRSQPFVPGYGYMITTNVPCFLVYPNPLY